MLKFGIYFFITCILSNFLLAQESIVRIAVVDYDKLMLSGNQEVLAILKKEAERYQEGLNKYTNEINALESQRQQYLAEDDRYNISRMERSLARKKEERQRYAEQSQKKLESKKKSILKDSNQDLGVILSAIEYVAEAQGFSLVIKSSDQNLLWWDYSIDITDSVIERIQQQ